MSCSFSYQCPGWGRWGWCGLPRSFHTWLAWNGLEIHKHLFHILVYIWLFHTVYCESSIGVTLLAAHKPYVAWLPANAAWQPILADRLGVLAACLCYLTAYPFWQTGCSCWMYLLPLPATWRSILADRLAVLVACLWCLSLLPDGLFLLTHWLYLLPARLLALLANFQSLQPVTASWLRLLHLLSCYLSLLIDCFLLPSSTAWLPASARSQSAFWLPCISLLLCCLPLLPGSLPMQAPSLLLLPDCLSLLIGCLPLLSDFLPGYLPQLSVPPTCLCCIVACPYC